MPGQRPSWRRVIFLGPGIFLIENIWVEDAAGQRVYGVRPGVGQSRSWSYLWSGCGKLGWIVLHGSCFDPFMLLFLLTAKLYRRVMVVFSKV